MVKPGKAKPGEAELSLGDMLEHSWIGKRVSGMEQEWIREAAGQSLWKWVHLLARTLSKFLLKAVVCSWPCVLKERSLLDCTEKKGEMASAGWVGN